MQRRLIVMRHATSAWNTGAGSDHARPLNGRGQRDAPRVARHLVEAGWEPDAVLSSDAERTRQTWAGMAPELTSPPDPTFTNALYHAGLEAIWEAAHGLEPEIETVLVLGHNPGWEQAVHRLTGQPEPMTTANAALLEGEGEDWPGALERRWALVDIVRPRELADD